MDDPGYYVEITNILHKTRKIIFLNIQVYCSITSAYRKKRCNNVSKPFQDGYWSDLLLHCLLGDNNTTYSRRVSLVFLCGSSYSIWCVTGMYFPNDNKYSLFCMCYLVFINICHFFSRLFGVIK